MSVLTFKPPNMQTKQIKKRALTNLHHFFTLLFTLRKFTLTINVNVLFVKVKHWSKKNKCILRQKLWANNKVLVH